MDLRKVKRFIELAEATGLAELEVRSSRGTGDERVDEHVRIVRSGRPSASDTPAPTAAAAPPRGARGAGPSHERGARGAGPSHGTEAALATAGHVVPAPMSGTFYRAPAPGEAPFVETGDTVAVGDVLCIIESMKMMNQIESEVAGQVSAVLLADGVPIETGAPLFRVV